MTINLSINSMRITDSRIAEFHAGIVPSGHSNVYFFTRNSIDAMCWNVLAWIRDYTVYTDNYTQTAESSFILKLCSSYVKYGAVLSALFQQIPELL